MVVNQQSAGQVRQHAIRLEHSVVVGVWTTQGTRGNGVLVLIRGTTLTA